MPNLCRALLWNSFILILPLRIFRAMVISLRADFWFIVGWLLGFLEKGVPLIGLAQVFLGVAAHMPACNAMGVVCDAGLWVRVC